MDSNTSTVLVIRTFDRGKLPDSLAELEGRYRATLSGRWVLILADDAKDSAQVRPLMPPAGSALLITSRRRFVLPSMKTLDLDALPVEAAAQLLLAICPRIAEHAPRLVELCGNLPLALRVSASILANDDALNVERYLMRLTDERTRLRALRDPDDPALNVEASLQLSYNALDADDRAALCQLGVFPAGFTSEATAAVLDMPLDLVDELLSRLRRRSLLEWDAATERNRFHDLMRAFAMAHLADADAFRRRHALYVARQLATAPDLADLLGLPLADQDDETDEDWGLFDEEDANVSTAFTWAQAHGGEPEVDAVMIVCANALLNPLVGFGVWNVDQLEAAVGAAQRLRRSDLEIQLLVWAGESLEFAPESSPFGYFERAIGVAHEIGDRSAEGWILIKRGLVHFLRGDTQPEVEVECYEHALAISREVGDRWMEGSSLFNLGGAYAGYYERGRYELNESSTASSGQRRAAIAELSQALEHLQLALPIWRELAVLPAEEATLRAIAWVYLDLDQSRQAIDYYEQALTVARQSPSVDTDKALFGLGEAYLRMGDLPRAAECYEQVLAATQHDSQKALVPPALYRLGGIYLDLGRFEDALAVLTQAIEQNSSHVDALALRGETYRRTEQFDAALADFSRALELDATYAWALTRRGMTYLELEQPDAALADFSRAIELNAQDASTVALRGEVYRLREQFDAALADFSRAIELDATYAWALTQRGMTYLELEQPDAALADFSRAIELEGSHASAFALRGAVYSRLNQPEAALADYTHAIELDGAYVAALIDRGQIYQDMSQYDAALADFSHAIELEPADPDAWFSRGMIYRLLGRPESALVDFTQALELNPDNAVFHRAQAQMYRALERYEEALGALRQAIELDSEDASAYVALAGVYRQLRREAEATAQAAHARTLLADDDAYGLATLEATCGDVDRALALLADALKQQPETTDWARADPDFAFIRDDPRFKAVLDS